ncbi:MAG: HIT family protein [Phycisphaerales bacterium]
MRESFVRLGENQGSRGWCVLITKDHVEHLACWPLSRQAALFGEVALVAAALRAVFPASGIDGPPRINYECLGNVVPHVHWHVIPRHADDPRPRETVWTWPPDSLRGSLSPTERADLVLRLRSALAASNA